MPDVAISCCRQRDSRGRLRSLGMTRWGKCARFVIFVDSVGFVGASSLTLGVVIARRAMPDVAISCCRQGDSRGRFAPSE